MTDRQVEHLSAVFTWLAETHNGVLAESYWQMIPPRQQYQLEHSPPFAFPVSYVFAARKDFERAREFALRLARYEETEKHDSAALLNYRLAVQWQQAANEESGSISPMSPEVYEKIERLFVGEKPIKEQAFVEELKATMHQERSLNEGKRADRLLELVLSSPLFKTLPKQTQEELVRFKESWHLNNEQY